MWREPDARAVRLRQARPETVQAYKQIVGEPAPYIGPELPIVLEAGASGFDVDVTVNQPEIETPKATLRVLAWREIEKHGQ
jgi:hypothetical protein